MTLATGNLHVHVCERMYSNAGSQHTNHNRLAVASQRPLCVSHKLSPKRGRRHHCHRARLRAWRGELCAESKFDCMPIKCRLAAFGIQIIMYCLTPRSGVPAVPLSFWPCNVVLNAALAMRENACPSIRPSVCPTVRHTHSQTVPDIELCFALYDRTTSLACWGQIWLSEFTG